MNINTRTRNFRRNKYILVRVIEIGIFVVENERSNRKQKSVIKIVTER